MSAIFLDTSGLIALTNTDDQWHASAGSVWQQLLHDRRTFVTTSLILIELADGLSKINFRSSAIKLVNSLRSSEKVQIVQSTHELEFSAWNMYASRADKAWGMTDCVSFTLMQMLNVSDVFGLDHHFEQAGF